MNREFAIKYMWSHSVSAIDLHYFNLDITFNIHLFKAWLTGCMNREFAIEYMWSHSVSAMTH